MNSYKEKQISNSNISKFAILSLIGGFLFLVPIKYQDGFNIPVGIIIDWVKSYIHQYTMHIMLFLVTVNALFSLVAFIFKPKLVMEHKWLKRTLVTTPLYLISRILGAIIMLAVFFQIGPEQIISPNTGGTMVDLTRSLVSILIVISYTMPLLTDFGIMEFVGILIKDFVRPLFMVPGRSAVDLITSWLGASNAAVLLTEKQYNTGYYSAKEAAIIMTNFSLVSVPFCYIIASILDVQHLFTPFYIIITAVGFALAIITPRIPPLSKVSETYNDETGKIVNEEVPEGKSKFQFAVESAALRAKNSHFRDIVNQGNDMLFSVIFGLAPIIISWGTISLILVEYTPVFKILSYPLGYYLNILGVEQAFQAAPAALVGFADMFIPALILAPMESVQTKFILGALSLVQIIYLTEVGTIIIQSKVPLKFKELLIIFLERTIIAIPLIVLLTKIFVRL
ncbi:YjiH family protein [Tissierella carlieri]|uniref:YjiH family protein n=1 Tax=Tissierella carlieri TaxID=689904 RepID=A0ABT1SH20_9FIRM|nr:YjiH family protein [Tissierella carlieri]